MADGKVTTVILIRHGERDKPKPNEPPFPGPRLNKDGQARAKLLVQVLGKSGIQAIYVSRFVRTKEMAQPLAAQLRLSTIDITEAPDIRKDILAKHAGQTVLVVGHADTVPQVIRELGGGEQPEIDDREFDNLFVVATFNSGKASATKLKYGKQSVV